MSLSTLQHQPHPKNLSSLELAEVLMDVVPRVMGEIRACNQVLKTSQMKVVGYRVLYYVWQYPRTNKALAQELAMGVPAMSRIINALEKSGMVDRVENPEDRREYFVHITEKGQKFYQEIRKKTCATLALRFEGVSQQDKGRIKESLGLMRDLVCAKPLARIK